MDVHWRAEVLDDIHGVGESNVIFAGYFDRTLLVNSAIIVDGREWHVVVRSEDDIVVYWDVERTLLVRHVVRSALNGDT